MHPFLFGPPHRRLFGLYHPAQPGAPRRRESVLLCAPFGQESVRAHRLLRVLADRLARDGFPVLRFDPYGTGDSAGADRALDLLGWQADIEAAHAQLMQRSPADHWAVWVAVRLAGAPAVRASRVAPGVRLVLLEPVVDGTAHLRELRERHVEALETSFDIVDPAWRAALRHDDLREVGEVMGFELSPLLREQLLELGPATLTVPAACEVTVLAPPGDTTVAAWVAQQRALGASVASRPVQHGFDWNSEEAINTALVPPDLLQRLIEEVRPS